MKHVLFLCSQNKLRSPTAEAIFTGRERSEVKSAGLNSDAAVPVSPELVEWADYIFVMENSHKNKLRKKYKRYLDTKKVICLNIPDEYEYMDAELIKMLKERLETFFENI